MWTSREQVNENTNDLEKWRPKAVSALQARFPQLKRDQQASTLLTQIVNNTHFKSQEGGVQARNLKMPDSTWKSLGEALVRISKSYAEEHKNR